MCGLVGLINKANHGFTKEQQDVFSTLLLVDYVRGPDSTGIFLVTNQGDVHVRKEASDPIGYMASEEYREVMKKAWSRGAALIGHNRKATRGVVNDENAHPFVVDNNIVLVHNGTLWGDHKKIADVEVDSHAIAHAIHENGDVQAVMNSIDGAYALIWYDFKNKKLNFLRNKERPLWVCETWSSWLWASERAMLDFVIARHGIKCKKDPEELAIDTLLSFELKMGGGWTTGETQLDIVKPVWDSGSHKARSLQEWLAQHDPENQSVIRRVLQQQPGNAAPFVEDVHDKLGFTDLNGVHHDLSMRDFPSNDHRRLIENSAWYDETRGKVGHSTVTASPGSTSGFEMTMMKRMGKIITNVQWRREVLPLYPYGSKILGVTFDYQFANQVDSKGGYYLYSYVCDDSDIVIRMWFPTERVTEEQMVQIASCEYVYEFVIENKQWVSFVEGAEAQADTPGYVIIRAERGTLVDNGDLKTLRDAKERTLQ